MLLCLLNSPRSTQDLDYAWIRSKPRNIFAEEIKIALQSRANILIKDVSVNSRGIFLTVADRDTGVSGSIEIGVVRALGLPPTPLTSAVLSNRYSLETKIIPTMNLAEAFSHKIAAALERNLARDLYDLMVLEPLTPFHEPTLRGRLGKLEINRAKAKSVSFQQASKMLGDKLEKLAPEKLNDELSSYLSKEQLAGVDQIIRASVSKVVRKLEML
jgi:predicted nucleotidyltransferase component of viral defense system